MERFHFHYDLPALFANQSPGCAVPAWKAGGDRGLLPDVPFATMINAQECPACQLQNVVKCVDYVWIIANDEIMSIKTKHFNISPEW